MKFYLISHNMKNNNILHIDRSIKDAEAIKSSSTFLPSGHSNSYSDSYNNTTSLLNMFNVNLKNDRIQKPKINNNNYAGKPRHYPPANKEWFNSIYAYNNTTKLLPAADKVILKLVKSYFNFYNRKLEKKVKSRRLRMRVRRLSTNRILVSRAELKHTNDKVIVTIYIYNRQKKYYLNKINKIATIDQIDNLLSNRVKKWLQKTGGPWPSALKMQTIREKSLKLKSKVIKQKKMLWKMLKLKNKADDNSFKSYHVKYLKYYVSRSLRKELLSVYFTQLISFNKTKFKDKYLIPLSNLVEKVYNKKIEFNLVNLKYLYLNSYIFSETLVTKLRNRKNKVLRVLKTSLLMFKLPTMNRSAVYDEIYNRKRKLQNLTVENIMSTSQTQSKDMLDLLSNRLHPGNDMTKLKNHSTYKYDNLINDISPIYLINSVLKSIKNKYVSGIRIEVAGRLTRRNTAARSLFKLRYKGNIKNMDSSYKGLSSVLLRGYAKSNLQYTFLKSRIRIGSFGLKGWVSSS